MFRWDIPPPELDLAGVPDTGRGRVPRPHHPHHFQDREGREPMSTLTADPIQARNGETGAPLVG